jgi:hypothetical protein
VVSQELDVGTIHLDAASGLLLQILLAAEGGEAPVLGDDDLLPARELVLRAAESLEGNGAVWEITSVSPDIQQLNPPKLLTSVTSADAHDDLTNVDTGDGAVGLAPRTTHTRLQSIGTGARQHLVDADDVVRVSADAQVEAFLAGHLDEVLVGADTRGLEGLGAQLLILVGHQVDAQREVVDGGTLAAEVEDADLGVRYTTVEPRLGVRL